MTTDPLVKYILKPLLTKAFVKSFHLTTIIIQSAESRPPTGLISKRGSRRNQAVPSLANKESDTASGSRAKTVQSWSEMQSVRERCHDGK